MTIHSTLRVRSLTFLFAVIIISCIGTHWVAYRSEEGGFTATFPGNPKREVKTVNTAQGPKEMQMYSLTEDQTSFSVVVSELPQGQLDSVGAAATLDGARDGAVANTQGKLLSELIVEVSGHPGRELKIAAAGGKATIRARLFLANNRLYQALVVTPTDQAYAPRVNRFLDSIKLL